MPELRYAPQLTALAPFPNWQPIRKTAVNYTLQWQFQLPNADFGAFIYCFSVGFHRQVQTQKHSQCLGKINLKSPIIAGFEVQLSFCTLLLWTELENPCRWPHCKRRDDDVGVQFVKVLLLLLPQNRCDTYQLYLLSGSSAIKRKPCNDYLSIRPVSRV